MSDEKSMSVNEALTALGSNLRVSKPSNFAPTEKEAEFSWNNDVPMTLLGWQRFIHQWAATKGWNQDLSERSFGDWMQLFVTEISEAYEDYRNHHKVNEIYYECEGKTYTEVEKAWTEKNIEEMNVMLASDEQMPRKTFKPCGIPIEVADLAIRMLHFCEHFGIDLNEMIALKMKYNETREYRHGGKKV